LTLATNGNDLGVVTGTSDTVTATGDIVDLGVATQATITGSGDQVGIFGNDSVTASNDTVIIAANNLNATVSGNSDTVTTGNDTGDTVTVAGNSDALTLATNGNDLGVVTGTSDTVTATGDIVDLGAATQATITGSGDQVGIFGNDSVTASNDTVIIAANNLNAHVSGNGDTVNTGSDTGDTVNVAGNGDTLDLASNGNDIGNLTGASETVNATGDIVNLGTATQATIVGSGDQVGVFGNDSVTVSNGTVIVAANNLSANVSGSSDTVTTGSDIGDTVAVSGNADTLDLASNGSDIGNLVGASETVNATGDIVNLGAGAQATINGSHDQVGLFGNDSVTVSNGTVIVAENGLNTTVYGSSDTVTTGNDTSDTVAVFGNGDTVDLTSNGNDLAAVTGTSDGIWATGDTVNLGANSLATVTGTYDTVRTTTGDNATVNGSSDTVDITGGSETIHASSDTINVADGLTTTIDGSNDTTRASHDTITYNGSSDATDGNYDTVYANGSYDFAYGTNDKDSDGVYGGSYSSWFSSGLAAGTNALMTVIGQFDLAHGFTAAAATAEAAWNRTQQVLAAAADPQNVAAPSPFNGGAWNTRVITWNFATEPGNQTTPFSGSIQTQYQAAIEQAFQTWSTVTGLSFAQVSDGTQTPDISIGWGSFDSSNSGLMGYTSFQVQAGQMQPGVVVRLEDPSQDALVTGPDGAFTYSGTQVELYQLALHEIGHALGLAESTDVNSVMFPELGQANQTLDATDTANIQQLYGLPMTGQTNVAAGATPGTGNAAMSSQLVQAIAGFGAEPLGAEPQVPTPATQGTTPTLVANPLH
jgi:predicted Zn-dependent protease